MSMNRTNAIAPNKYREEHSRNSQAGSSKSNDPRLVGDILAEMFSGNSPLAKGYRAHFANKSNAEEGGTVL